MRHSLLQKLQRFSRANWNVCRVFRVKMSTYHDSLQLLYEDHAVTAQEIIIFYRCCVIFLYLTLLEHQIKVPVKRDYLASNNAVVARIDVDFKLALCDAFKELEWHF